MKRTRIVWIVATAAWGGLAGACSSPPAESCRGVQGKPGASPEGYLLDGWAWHKDGAVFELPGAVEWGGASPAAVFEGGAGELMVVFSTRQGGTIAFHVMDTQDGESWSVPIDLQGVEHANPFVVREENRYRLWSGSGFIQAYESQDGFSYRPIEGSEFFRAHADTFDSVAVQQPAVLLASVGRQDVRMWYTGFSGNDYAIGLATSPDEGITWQRPLTEPVLARGEATEFDNRAVSRPWVVAGADGILRMWYSGYDTSRTDPGPWRTGLAESQDGILWVKKGLSLDLGPGQDDAYAVRDPAVIYWKGRWRLFYVGLGEDNIYRLMWASSTVCNLL